MYRVHCEVRRRSFAALRMTEGVREISGWNPFRPMMNFNNQDRQPKPQRPCCRDKGRCGDGRGPGACPRHHTIRVGSVRETSRTPARTSTRPPPPPHTSPCPYRTLGRLRPSHYRFWLSIFIIGRNGQQPELSPLLSPSSPLSS